MKRNDWILITVVLAVSAIFLGIHVFRPQLAADFWRALLKGEVSDKQDAKRRMELAGIVFPDRGLCCVAAVWKGKENLNGKDLKNSIEEAAKGALHVLGSDGREKGGSFAFP